MGEKTAVLTAKTGSMLGSPDNHTYGDFCPLAPQLGAYLEGLEANGYPEILKNAFAASANFGQWMVHRAAMRQGTSGLYVVIGDPADLDKAASDRCTDHVTPKTLTQRYGRGILSDPEKTLSLLEEIGRMESENGYDGAVCFDPEGSLAKTFVHINNVDINMVDPAQIRLAKMIKASNGDPCKTISALYATGQYGIQAVLNSEGPSHATTTIVEGTVFGDMTYNPLTGLYGPELLKELHLAGLDLTEEV